MSAGHDYHAAALLGVLRAWCEGESCLCFNVRLVWQRAEGTDTTQLINSWFHDCPSILQTHILLNRESNHYIWWSPLGSRGRSLEQRLCGVWHSYMVHPALGCICKPARRTHGQLRPFESYYQELRIAWLATSQGSQCSRCCCRYSSGFAGNLHHSAANT